jgi:hypothetical protein
VFGVVAIDPQGEVIVGPNAYTSDEDKLMTEDLIKVKNSDKGTKFGIVIKGIALNPGSDLFKLLESLGS